MKNGHTKLTGKSGTPPMRKAAGESRGARGEMGRVKRVAGGKSVNAGAKMKRGM